MGIKRAISILSGGLDSAVSLYLGAQEFSFVLALTFDYGQRAAAREIAAAQKICENLGIIHQIISLPWLEKISTSALTDLKSSLPQLSLSELDNLKLTDHSARAVWVPNRNGLLINIAGCFADQLQAEIILTGFNREEAMTFPDNSSEFNEAITHSLAYSTQVHPRVLSLTQSMDKSEIVQAGLKRNVPFEILWSCYTGEEKMCGQCESCMRSIRAYQKAGIQKRMKACFKEGSFLDA